MDSPCRNGSHVDRLCFVLLAFELDLEVNLKDTIEEAEKELCRCSQFCLISEIHTHKKFKRKFEILDIEESCFLWKSSDRKTTTARDFLCFSVKALDWTNHIKSCSYIQADSWLSTCQISNRMRGEVTKRTSVSFKSRKKYIFFLKTSVYYE